MTYRQILQAIVTKHYLNRDEALCAIDEAFAAGTITVKESKKLEAIVG